MRVSRVVKDDVCSLGSRRRWWLARSCCEMFFARRARAPEETTFLKPAVTRTLRDADLFPSDNDFGVHYKK